MTKTEKGKIVEINTFLQGFCRFYEGTFKTFFLRPSKENLKNKWKRTQYTNMLYLNVNIMNVFMQSFFTI